jgi:acyl carrier protein
MSREILQNVIDFFGKNTKIPIDDKTQINNHLQIVGDDAYFIMLDFEKKFNISLNGIDLDDYFLRENALIYWYYKWFKPEKLIKKPLTIGHLAEVVEKGRWFEPNS